MTKGKLQFGARDPYGPGHLEGWRIGDAWVKKVRPEAIEDMKHFIEEYGRDHFCDWTQFPLPPDVEADIHQQLRLSGGQLSLKIMILGFTAAVEAAPGSASTGV